MIDGTQATFNGLTGSAMTSAQLAATEARIRHYTNDTTVGLVILLSSYISVDPLSGNLLIIGTPGNANISLTFAPPASDGGLPITSYTATCSAPGVLKTATNNVSPVTVRGLVNGMA